MMTDQEEIRKLVNDQRDIMRLVTAITKDYKIVDYSLKLYNEDCTFSTETKWINGEMEYQLTKKEGKKMEKINNVI